MTSTGQIPQPWKTTAATLFNPYLNINQSPNTIRQQQQSIRTRILTPNRHARAPPESLVGHTNFNDCHSDSSKKSRSRPFPTPNASEEVSIYVQQMIHNQFCGRSGTPSDMRYDQQTIKRTLNTPNHRNRVYQKQIPLRKQQSRVSDYELDDFFMTSDEQISRVASMMPGRESTFSENYSQWGESPRHRSNTDQGLTLAHMCHIASNVGDKMSQSKEKVGLEAIRGFRLPSARLTYEPYEYHSMESPLVLGQHTPIDRVRLQDVLTDDNFSSEPMIEIVGGDSIDDRASRNSRTHFKSRTPTTMKINQFKDWRGQITQTNLSDTRNQFRRQPSGSTISPQRPCTAASNLSKSRPDSSAVHINQSQKEEQQKPLSFSTMSASVGSVLKNPGKTTRRRRSHPLNVRIVDETILKQNNDQNTNVTTTETILDPPALSLQSENTDEKYLVRAMVPRSTPDPFLSTSSTPIDQQENEETLSPDSREKKRSYRLIPSLSGQIYKTISPSNVNSTNVNPSNEQFSQLTLSQLELLENYDPMLSAQLGIPFLPVQMLVRPKDANQSTKRTIEQIENEYPKKNGQPVFEQRSSHHLINTCQTLQLTKSKRLPLQRQTTFERVDTDQAIEQTIQIKSIENPNRLTMSIYSPSEQRFLVKHTNSTRTSSKAHPSQLDDIPTLLSDRSKDDQRLEYNLSVVNLQTQQEVDQMRRRERISPKRLLFPTSIVTNASLPVSRQRNIKEQGRPIPSVFLTEDPDEYNYSTSIYRQARNDTDIKRAFKGFILENIQRKLSADQRKVREEQQKAAIRIQRAYREHLFKRKKIENRRSRPSTSQSRDHRRILSAKRAQFVEQRLIDQTQIRDQNQEFQKLIDDTGPSLRIFASFNQVDAQFSRSTLNRAATCIQRWWRGFIVRHRWSYLKGEVTASGLIWSDFSRRYRGVIERIQTIRQSNFRQFIFNLDQARDFLVVEKKLTTIFNTLSFNGKLDPNELEQFFQSSDLSATTNEIQEALKSVLQYYPHQKSDSLKKEIVFDIVYYIYPPVGTGLQTSRQSTWVRPIIDGEDETAIQGTSFLEPIDINVIYQFLEKE